MSQRNESKQRKCHVCDFYFVTTAKEIKAHAEACAKKQQEGKKKNGINHR